MKQPYLPVTLAVRETVETEQHPVYVNSVTKQTARREASPSVVGALTTVNEFGPKQHVGVLEHALFQGHDNELRMLKVILDHCTNVLRVAQVQSRINLIASFFKMRMRPSFGRAYLVQDVHRCRFEQKQRQNK